MDYDYDLLVIGAGSGGLAAAKRAASHGARVAIAEAELVGGTCVVRGCVPKKLLVYGSRFAHLFADARGYGWQGEAPQLSWSTLIQAVDAEVSRLSQLHTGFLQKAGVELIQGLAEFVDPHTAAVGERKVSAERILIATGSKAILPEIAGVEHGISSRQVFKLATQPQRLAIIGGGYIGVEFAGVFNSAGTEVIQILRGDQILRGFDQDIRDHLQTAMAQRGVHFLLHTEVERLEQSIDGTTLFFKGNTAPITVDAAVLFAIGRAPNTEDLHLERAGVETKAKAVAVNDHSQTNQAHIYAIGDVTNRVNLTPVAVEEGRVFADRVYGHQPRQVSYDNIPTAVFSQPEAATVGLTEAEAVDRYGESQVKIYRSRFRPLFYNLTGFQEKTLMKLVVERQSGRVVGVHMVGKDAAEIIQAAAIAVNMGATKQDFDSTMALHPSTAEELVTMT